MKYVQVIFSPTGGTKKAAEMITSEWSKSVETVDLTDGEKDFAELEFEPEDIVLAAMPSFGGRVPALAAGRFSKIQGNHAKCVLLCVYGNRAYEDTLREMADMAEEAGFVVAAAVSAVAEHSIIHQYAAGRPDEEDARCLKGFAKEILEKIQAGELKEVEIPGNRPYKNAGGVGLVPKAAKNCVNCGLCAKQCPAQAISREDVKCVDGSRCISCMRCVELCPHSARKVNGGMVAVASLALKKACSVRKDCELFI